MSASDVIVRYERPPSCPREGMLAAYDAGWNAFEVGLERETVELLAHPSGQGWALLAYDTCALVANPRRQTA